MKIDYTQKRLTTLQIYYYMPDHQSVIQEFVWQYEDLKPTFPRTHKFLQHWHENIEAVIQEILLAHINRYGQQQVRKVDWSKGLF